MLFTDCYFVLTLACMVCMNLQKLFLSFKKKIVLLRPVRLYDYNWFSSMFQLSAQTKEISSLENTVAALKEDYERSLSANAATKKDLQENLITAKHELLRVQEQLSLAEKVPLYDRSPSGELI